METPRPSPIAQPPESLRAARERAEGVVGLGKSRLHDLEATFSDRLAQIADALAVELDAEQADAEAVGELALEQAKQKFASQQSNLQDERNQLASELASRDAELADAREQLGKQESTHDELQSQLAERDRLLTERDEQLAELDQQLGEHQRLSAEASAGRDQLAGQVSALESQLDSLSSQLKLQLSEVDELRKERDTLQITAKQQSADLDQARDKSEKLAAQLKQLTQTHRADVSQLNERIGRYEVELRSAGENAGTSEGRVAELEQLTAEAQRSRDEALRECQSLREQITELTTTIEKLSERAEQASSDSVAFVELQQQYAVLQQQVSELQSQIAAAADLEQSAIDDIESLTSDRKQLRDRIAELEASIANTPVTDTAAEDDGRVTELEQRLEMALDDLRAVKLEKEELETQLAKQQSVSANAAIGTPDDALDWESQKRRLLASLEGEAEPDAARERELLKIEQVIQKTDRSIATLKAEAEELRQQLATANSMAADSSAATDQASLETAVDADQHIQEQRARMAQMEAEMSEKLRTLELDLSVERAKIAREQQELGDWRIELEELHERLAKVEPGGKPRRRWLDQLGLGKSDES